MGINPKTSCMLSTRSANWANPPGVAWWIVTERVLQNYTMIAKRPNFAIRDSIVASIPACHAGDRGSIPRRGEKPFYLCLLQENHQFLSWSSDGVNQSLSEKALSLEVGVKNSQVAFNQGGRWQASGRSRGDQELGGRSEPQQQCQEPRTKERDPVCVCEGTRSCQRIDKAAKAEGWPRANLPAVFGAGVCWWITKSVIRDPRVIWGGKIIFGSRWKVAGI